MNNDRSSAMSHDRTLSQLVEKSCRQWEARRKRAAEQRNLVPHTANAFTIALEREAGTQDASVASEVGKRLGWHVYDHELLEQIAQEMGLRTALLESVDERQQSWMRETIQASLASLVSGERFPWASETAYIHRLVETVHALGVHGECVIVGRAAAFMLPVETTLRVRLVGPVRQRVAALAHQRGVSEREVAAQVRTIDRERKDFVWDHFFKDAVDPSNYDLVLNALRLSVTQTAELIVETLHRLQARAMEKNTARPLS